MNKEQRLEWLPTQMITMMGGEEDSTVEEREAVVRAWQAKKGLKVDGWFGRKSFLALYEIKDNPVPNGRGELASQIGDPSWVKGSGRSVDLNDNWEHANIVWSTVYVGKKTKKIRVHKKYEHEIARLIQIASDVSGYRPDSIQTFNPRVIGGTDRLSMHAYGIAIDFDPPKNPWGGGGVIRNYPLFIEIFELAGWTWGGRWKGATGKPNTGDDMHFQRCGT